MNILAYYTEKLHRYVFDNIYFNNEERKRRKLPIGFTLKEKIILRVYKLMVKLNPNFRKKINSKRYNYVD